MFLSGISSAPTAQSEVLDAALHEVGKIVGRLAFAVILRRAEQQVEIAVAHPQAALQVADAVLGAELALQALEHRAQQTAHERERARFAALRGLTTDQAEWHRSDGRWRRAS